MILTALLVGAGVPAGVASPAQAADGCSAPAPPVDGVVTAAPILVAGWQGTCAVGAPTCTFTVDASTLGGATTNPGATIDYATLVAAAPPAGYTFSYDAATFVLTLTVTSSTPGQVSSYTVQDSTGEVSNAATIELPAISIPAVVAPDIAASQWILAALPPNPGPCQPGDGFCAYVIDLASLGATTNNPGATIDWDTFTVSSTPPGYTFLLGSDQLTVLVTVTVAPVPPPTYTVQDTAGTVSAPAVLNLPVAL